MTETQSVVLSRHVCGTEKLHGIQPQTVTSPHTGRATADQLHFLALLTLNTVPLLDPTLASYGLYLFKFKNTGSSKN
jgi:hypothetical protein